MTGRRQVMKMIQYERRQPRLGGHDFHLLFDDFAEARLLST